MPEIVTPEVGHLATSESELAAAVGDMGRYDRRRCHEYVCDEFSAELMTRRYLELYQRVMSGETLHETEPVKPATPESALLPMAP